MKVRVRIIFTEFLLSLIVVLLHNCGLIPNDNTQTNNTVITNIIYEDYPKSTNWTWMFYSAADDLELEQSVVNDIGFIKQAITPDTDINIIVLIDRYAGGYQNTSVFGENFSDTRMYRILPNAVERLKGDDNFKEISLESNYEANMADAKILKKFIKYVKYNYPAKYYALFIAGHGDGMRSKNKINTKSFVSDTTSENANDRLFLAEVTDILDENDSVDLLGFDTCFMSTIEVIYQYRKDKSGFHADYILASAPLQYGGWQYYQVLKRINNKSGDNGEDDLTIGGKESYISSTLLTPKILGEMIIEERRDFCYNYFSDQTISLIDTSKVSYIKLLIDKFVSNLIYNTNELYSFVSNVRGVGNSNLALNYFNENDPEEWVTVPYFDVYDLFMKVVNNKILFSSNNVALAKEICSKIDEMIVYSYGGISNFEDNKNGVSIFFPDGSIIYNNKIGWEYLWWYNSLDVRNYGNGSGYGKLLWCIDNSIISNNIVENWFEFLDYLYDTNNNYSNDINGYIY